MKRINKIKALHEKYNISDDVQEVADNVTANAFRQANKNDKKRKEYIDTAIKNVTDRKMYGPVNHNPKRSAASKKMMLSESLFENASKVLTKDELKKLRSEISLNSLYTGDYENSFGFKPEDVQMFFDSYLEELEEILIEEHNFNEDEIELQDLFKIDTIDNLYNYYLSVENLPF